MVPELGARVGGAGFRVPSGVDVSLLDLTVELRTAADLKQICSALNDASCSQPLRGRLGYRGDDVEAADLVADGRSAIFDGRASMAVSPRMVKLIAWFPHEWPYCRRLVELLLHMQVVDASLVES